MDTKNKNKPATIYIIGISAIAIAIISYFLILMFFPEAVHDMLTGDEPAVVK